MCSYVHVVVAFRKQPYHVFSSWIVFQRSNKHIHVENVWQDSV